MIVKSVLVLVGMPTIGLLVETLPESAGKTILRDWGAAGAIVLVGLALLAYFIKRVEDLTNRLFEVIKANSEVISRVCELMSNCEIHQIEPKNNRKSHGD